MERSEALRQVFDALCDMWGDKFADAFLIEYMHCFDTAYQQLKSLDDFRIVNLHYGKTKTKIRN